MKLPSTAPAAIIGGGIIGCSTLYHLARRGVSGVLVERKQIASGTTWHAAGLVGQLRDSRAQTELVRHTANLFQTLEEETGLATGYKANGTMHLALSGTRLEQLRRSHDHAERMQIESVLLSPDEAAGVWPAVDYADVLGAFLVPSNGQVNPLDATRALAAGARMNGAEIFENTRATRILARNGRVTGLETDNGVITTGKVVLAAGMWSARFARAHGLNVPLHAAEHWYIVTEPIPGLPRDLPGLVVPEERSYWKEDAGRLLIGGFDARGKVWAPDGIPESFEFDELPFDMDHAEPILEAAYSRMPALRETGIRTFFNGPESFTPDGKPLVGPVPGMSGLFVAAGMNSMGIMNSGGVGRTLSEWLTDDMPGRGLGSMLASRAMPFQTNLAYNAERVAEGVGLNMGLQWPGRQTVTARGIRRLPLHDRLVESGAQMAERAGWEVPMYFAPRETWPTRISIGYQDWSPHVARECLAARDAAVLLDQSMYGKLVVAGRDAALALNHVCGARVEVAPGTSVYTQLLNSRGGIEADVTVTRISETRFILLTGHPSQVRDAHWITRQADPEWAFDVVDMTSAYSLVSLHGPRSRAILQSMTGDDLSADAFPFGAAREIDLAHARAFAIRRSFLGELGFELLLPTEFTAHVYEALVREGNKRGLRHMGVFAMNACRLEKGFCHFGHDIAEDDTPYEAGLGFAVDLNRPDFLGKNALSDQQERFGTATPNRTVKIAVPALDEFEGPYLAHNETIWKDGSLVGYVTSGGWGHRVGCMIGIASLHREGGVRREWVESGGFSVQIAGQRHDARLQIAPFYDPQGTRMRA